MKRALLIVDMLKDFVEDDGALKVNGAEEIVPFIKGLKAGFERENSPVIYVCDSHSKNDPEFELWPPHCVEGTKGAEIVDDLKPNKNNYIIKKKTYSGFHGTNLDDLLKKLDIKTLWICGVAMNICVHYTAADARMNGYEVIVPVNGTKGLTEEDEEYMKKQFVNVLKVNLV